MNRSAEIPGCFKAFLRLKVVRSCILLVLVLLVSTASQAQSITGGATTDLSLASTDTAPPIVVVSADGTKAVAAWIRRESGSKVLQTAAATVSGNTATWSSPSDLTSPGINALTVDIALSEDGTKAIAVWDLFNGDNEVHAATATIDGNVLSWSSSIKISEAVPSLRPKVGLSADGTRATAVWREFDSGTTFIRSASATIAGGTATWGTRYDLSDNSQSADTPRIAISADGQLAVAVWLRSDGSNQLVESAPASINGVSATWGAVTAVSAVGGDASDLKVALARNGQRGTAIWLRSDGSHTLVQSASVTVASNIAGWGAVTDLSAAGQNSTAPQLALSEDGTVGSAVWSRSDGTTTVVQGRSATFSGTVGTWGAIGALSESGRNAAAPQIRLSSDGSKVVSTWQRQNDAGTITIQTIAGILDGGSVTWGELVDLSDETLYGVAPGIGLSSDGALASVAWLYSDLTNSRIQSRSVEVSFVQPTPTPTITPTATGTAVPPTPTATATPIGVPAASAPRLRLKIKEDRITVSIQEKAKTRAVRHFAYVIRNGDSSIFKKIRIPIKDGKGTVAIRNVPSGVYRVFVVTKRSVNPKTVSSSIRVVTIE